MKSQTKTAADMVGSQYDLVLIAAQRVRELRQGATAKVKPEVTAASTAIKEIEQGKIGREYLSKILHKKKATKGRKK